MDSSNQPERQQGVGCRI